LQTEPGRRGFAEELHNLARPKLSVHNRLLASSTPCIE
jgi:hypothetical protein